MLGIYHTSTKYNAYLAEGLRWTGDKTFSNDETTAHLNVRDGVLSLQVHDKAILEGDLNRIDDFRIGYEEEMIFFTLPDSEHLVVIPFEEVFERIQDQAFLNDFSFLIGEAQKRIEGDSRFKISPKAKGNLKGDEALLRKTDATNALPKDFKKFSKEMLPRVLQGKSKEYCDVVMRQHQVVEYIHSKLIPKLDEKIEKREKELAAHKQTQPTPGIIRNQTQLEHAIKQLKARKEAFEKMDGYAMAMKLSVPDMQELESHVRSHLKGILNPKKGILDWLKFWQKAPTAEPGQDEEAYIHDLMALGMGRAEYFKYCKEKGIEQKKERLEDILVREAIKFARDPNYKPDTLVGSLIFDEMPESVKEELDKDLESIGKVAPHAIGHTKDGEFAPKPYPKDSTPQQQQQIDKDNFEQLQKDIESMEGRVNHDLTIDQIPVPSPEPVPEPPPPPAPVTGIKRFVPSPKTGIAIGLAAAGLYTGVAQSVARYVWNDPGTSLKLAFQGNGAFNAIRSLLPSRTEMLVGLTTAVAATALTEAGKLDLSHMPLATFNFFYDHPAVAYALLHTARVAPSVISSLAHTGEGVNRRWSKRHIVGLLAGAGTIGTAVIYPNIIPSFLQSATEYAAGATSWVVQQAWDYAFQMMAVEVFYRTMQSQGALPPVVQSVVNEVQYLPQFVKAPAKAAYQVLSAVGAVSRVANFVRNVDTLFSQMEAEEVPT